MSPKDLADQVARLRDRIMLHIYPSPELLLVLPQGAPLLPSFAADLIGVRVERFPGPTAPCLGIVVGVHADMGLSDMGLFANAQVTDQEWSKALPDLAEKVEYLVPSGVFDGLTAAYGRPLYHWDRPGIFVGFRIEDSGGSAA